MSSQPLDPGTPLYGFASAYSDDDEFALKAEAAYNSQLANPKTDAIGPDSVLSSPSQTALTQDAAQVFKASRSLRPPTPEEEIAEQIMRVAGAYFANGAVGGMNRIQFEEALRLALQRLMRPAGQSIDPYIGDIDHYSDSEAETYLTAQKAQPRGRRAPPRLPLSYQPRRNRR